MTGEPMSRPTAPSTTLSARNESSAVRIAVFMRWYCPAPKSRLTITDAPMPPPPATQMKMFVNE